MSTSKLKWIIPTVMIALVLLGVLAWQIISRQMAAQAELKVQQTLQRFDLADKAQWEKLCISPFGDLTFNNLRIEISQNNYLTAAQVHISDVIDQADHQRFSVQLKQAKPELSTMALTGVSETLLNPMDINLQLDLNFASNQAHIIYSSQQKGVADIELQLHLSQIGPLRGLLGAIFPQSAKASADLDPNFIGLNRLAATYSISLNAFDGKINNHGLLEQITERFKQKITGGAHHDPETAFTMLSQEVQSSCHGGADNLKQPCQNLAEFILGKKNSLHLTANPAQPVSLEQLDEAIIRGNSETVFKLLNINIQ